MSSKYTIATKAIIAVAVLMASAFCSSSAFGFQGELSGHAASGDILLESKIHVQTLQFANLREDIDGFPGDRFTAFNSSARPTTNLGTDFGSSLAFIHSEKIEFRVQHANDRDANVVLTDVFIARRSDPFSFSREQIDSNLTNSFRANISNGDRVNVHFTPQMIGLIEADLMIDYTVDGWPYRARVQLAGRGFFYWPQQSIETVSDSKFITGSSFRDNDQGNDPHYIKLEFERPVAGATIYVVPKPGSPKLNVNMYNVNSWKDETQFHDFGRYYKFSVRYTGGVKSELGIKVAIDTMVDSAITDYDIYIFGNSY
jgi:hypothetical protein